MIHRLYWTQWNSETNKLEKEGKEILVESELDISQAARELYSEGIIDTNDHLSSHLPQPQPITENNQKVLVLPIDKIEKKKRGRPAKTVQAEIGQ
jgi:hypothetical protein